MIGIIDFFHFKVILQVCIYALRGSITVYLEIIMLLASIALEPCKKPCM